MEEIIITKEEYDILDSAICFANFICMNCGRKITRDNFGHISRDYHYCRREECRLMFRARYLVDGLRR